MATTIMEKDDKINELEAQLKTVEEECGTRGRTLISRADQITRLQAEAEILKEAKKDLDKTLDQRASTIIEQMKKVTEANESYEKLRKDANDLVKEYRQIDSLNKTLQEEIKALKNSAKAKEEETTKQHLKEPKRIESPPPGYGEVHTVEGSFHFEAPKKTGMGRTDDHDKEKVKKEDTESAKVHSGPSGGSNSKQQKNTHDDMPEETIVYKSDYRLDDREDPRDRQNEQERVAREEERREREHRAEYHAEAQRLRREEREFRGIMRAMSRKSALIDFNGNREALLGWIRQVKETQKTYDLSDAAMMLEVANAVKGDAKAWFDAEREIDDEEEADELTVDEWMTKFKEHFGDRDEGVNALREAMTRKFETGKETLDQFYQAIMRFKSKRVITEKQAIGFLIQGCQIEEVANGRQNQSCPAPVPGYNMEFRL
ncbi:trichohyalin-like [Paramacrobiotus metropolitanus]|uniref:trichohyalin-like n=1 Tax=Paramacrobiotus metropolitanus TaxID=2943436 RepID=UPI002445D8D4|nr:trichohyalin-like [Paramacrobiotus metropolitanus]